MWGDEFDRTTPAYLATLRDAWRDRQFREDRRAGMVTYLIANANRDPRVKREPYMPWDFFESLERLRPPPVPDEVRFEELAARLC